MRLRAAVVTVASVVVFGAGGSAAPPGPDPAPAVAAAQAAGGGQAQARAGRLPSIAERTADLRRIDGFFPLYWDEASGSLYLEIPRLDAEVLYVTGLAAGMGSNDVGLDRAQLGSTRIVSFQRVGTRVLMVQPNYDYRATSDNPDERRAVEDAFAKSVLWGFTAIAETEGRVLVDLGDFLMRDTTNVANRLRPATYRFERSRSAVYLPNTRGFPQNTEIEVTSTFITDSAAGGPGQAGGRIQDVVPSPEAMTVRQHHSIIALPGPGYAPRAYDPRAGYSGMSYVDYAAPLGASMEKRFIRRHRLEKRDPRAAVSEPVRPIVYYLDRGTPEPVRSALIEGARWWNEAFEAAGFRNAFRVEVMPEGADPMDVRYNTITWVHRSTRGWSYGSSVSDPRTGEIIKGHVTLGSLRVRQDYLIFEGLLSPYATGTETPPVLAETALARLRQLSAHEVGHTIGLGHNYYNSSRGRISVLDYPHPFITLRADGTLDLSQAYGAGIGEWDKVAIRYGYSHFAPGTDEAAALRKILDDAWGADVRYLTNQDLALHPGVDQWNNGTDTAEELNRLLALRRSALGRFGDAAIRLDAPMALLEDVLVPLYLHHRYAAESAATAIGGQEYIYALRGDGRQPVRPVPAARQDAALAALIRTLAPAELALSPALIAKIPPRPAGYGRTRELFPRTTGGAFDPIAPPVVAADMVLGFILTSDRAARLVAQKALDPSLPGLEDVLGRLLPAVFESPRASPYEEEIGRGIERAFVQRLMNLADAPNAQVRALVAEGLRAVKGRLDAVAGGGPLPVRAHRALLASDIGRFLDRPWEAARPAAVPSPPPGAPIGDVGLDYLLGFDACAWRGW